MTFRAKSRQVSLRETELWKSTIKWFTVKHLVWLFYEPFCAEREVHSEGTGFN